jgi:hypothetical protein
MLKMEPLLIANSSKHMYMHLGDHTTLLLCKRGTSEVFPVQTDLSNYVVRFEAASTVVTVF